MSQTLNIDIDITLPNYPPYIAKKGRLANKKCLYKDFDKIAFETLHSGLSCSILKCILDNEENLDYMSILPFVFYIFLVNLHIGVDWVKWMKIAIEWYKENIEYFSRIQYKNHILSWLEQMYVLTSITNTATIPENKYKEAFMNFYINKFGEDKVFTDYSQYFITTKYRIREITYDPTESDGDWFDMLELDLFKKTADDIFLPVIGPSIPPMQFGEEIEKLCKRDIVAYLSPTVPLLPPLPETHRFSMERYAEKLLYSIYRTVNNVRLNNITNVKFIQDHKIPQILLYCCLISTNIPCENYDKIYYLDWILFWIKRDWRDIGSKEIGEIPDQNRFIGRPYIGSKEELISWIEQVWNLCVLNINGLMPLLYVTDELYKKLNYIYEYFSDEKKQERISLAQEERRRAEEERKRAQQLERRENEKRSVINAMENRAEQREMFPDQELAKQREAYALKLNDFNKNRNQIMKEYQDRKNMRSHITFNLPPGITGKHTKVLTYKEMIQKQIEEQNRREKEIRRQEEEKRKREAAIRKEEEEKRKREQEEIRRIEEERRRKEEEKKRYDFGALMEEEKRKQEEENRRKQIQRQSPQTQRQSPQIQRQSPQTQRQSPQSQRGGYQRGRGRGGYQRGRGRGGY